MLLPHKFNLPRPEDWLPIRTSENILAAVVSRNDLDYWNCFRAVTSFFMATLQAPDVLAWLVDHKPF
jgi:hypothetical protein